MSHSQFHSTNLFILRHAWLNLWDKHMTTGRINQVTTIRNRVQLTPHPISTTSVITPSQEFSLGRSSSQMQRDTLPLTTQGKAIYKSKSPPYRQSKRFNNLNPPCTPISQVSGQLLPVLKGQRSWPSVRTTSDRPSLKGTHSHGGSPSG